MVHLIQILHTYVLYHFLATGMKNGDKASPSTIFAGRTLLVKMHGIFHSNFVYLFITLYGHCDEASPSIILPGRALLVKLITLEPHCIF